MVSPTTSWMKVTSADEDFLKKCEEELKDRYTEKDIEFMKIFTAEKRVPPIIIEENRNNTRYADHHHRDNNSKRGRNNHYDNYNQRNGSSSRSYNRYDREGGRNRGYNHNERYNHREKSSPYGNEDSRSQPRQEYSRGYSDYDR